ncbi:MAG: hypothetical protein KDB03_00335 [Planctomycetales bacterium]|nr:hypothetical protein [Planctomycetales bacterium]
MTKQLDFASVLRAVDSTLLQAGLPNLTVDARVFEEFMSRMDRVNGAMQADARRLAADLEPFDPVLLARGYIARLILVGISNRQLLQGVYEEIQRIGVHEFIEQVRARPQLVNQISGAAEAYHDVTCFANATSKMLSEAVMKLMLIAGQDDPNRLQELVRISSHLSNLNAEAARRQREQAVEEAKEAEMTPGISEVFEIIRWIVIVVAILIIVVTAIIVTPHSASQNRVLFCPILISVTYQLQRANQIAGGCVSQAKLDYEKCLRLATNPNQIAKCTSRYLASLARECRLAN